MIQSPSQVNPLSGVIALSEDQFQIVPQKVFNHKESFGTASPHFIQDGKKSHSQRYGVEFPL